MVFFIAPLFAMLSGCGGGGSDSKGGNSNPSAGGNDQAVSKTFTVSLANIEVRRVSNGNSLDVDASNISRDLVFKQK